MELVKLKQRSIKIVHLHKLEAGVAVTSFQMDVSTSSSGDSPLDSSQISLKSTAIKHASSFPMLGKAVIVIVVIGSSIAA